MDRTPRTSVQHLTDLNTQRPKLYARQPQDKIKPIALAALIAYPRACPFEIAKPVSVCPTTEWTWTVLQGHRLAMDA
jgi:hypothetical protein